MKSSRTRGTATEPRSRSTGKSRAGSRARSAASSASRSRRRFGRVIHLHIEFDRETGGERTWIADIPAIPGVMAYGKTRQDATLAVKVLALRVLADMVEHGEVVSLLEFIIFTMEKRKW